MQFETGDLVELKNYTDIIGIVTDLFHRYEGTSYKVYWFDTEEVSNCFAEDINKVGVSV